MRKPVQLEMFVSRKGAKVNGVKNTILAPNTKIAEIREILIKEKKARLVEKLARAEEKKMRKLTKFMDKNKRKLELVEKKLQIRADKINAYELAWRVIDGKVISNDELIREAWGIVRILSPPKKDRKDRHAGFFRIFGATAKNPKELELARLKTSHAIRFINGVEYERRRIKLGLPYNL